MTPRLLVRCGACALAAIATAVGAANFTGLVTVATFNAGRFVTAGGEVYSGLFASNVHVDTLTVGEATYRARFDEFLEAATVRVYVAPARDAEQTYQLLSDEQIASGRYGVSFGLGRGIDRSPYVTALDTMQGMDLARSLYTDGTMRVRVDLLLTAPLRDSHPGEADLTPEALIIGGFSDQTVRLGAIVAGNVDQPVLARQPVLVDSASFEGGFTGVAVLLDGIDEPQPVSIVGLDLHDLGVRSDTAALGYRLEIEPGRPVNFNIVGAGRDGQRDLASPLALLDEPEAFAVDLALMDGWEPRGGGGGGRPFATPPFAPGNTPGGGGGFTGGGGGGGGGTPPALRAPPGDPEDPGNGGNGPGDGGGNGPGDGGGNGPGNGGPIVPAPGTLLIVIASALGCRRRRRRPMKH